MLFDKVSFFIILVEFFDFSSEFDSFVVVVYELEENVFDVRGKKFEIGEDGDKVVHFLLELGPNEFFFA